MELQHVNVKIPVDGELTVDPGQFIEVFHRWIRENTLEGLLIDVADYRHVPNGPGVMLIGFDADYSMDNADGQWGLLYNRKSPQDGSNQDRLTDAVKRAAHTCDLLEQEFEADGLRFSATDIELIINDRALAPNTDETWDACQGEFESFLKSALGHDDYEMKREPEPRRRFGVKVHANQPAEFGKIA